MTVERTFRCDGPECDGHMTHCVTPVPPCPGWLVVHETNGVGVDDEPRIFCSWDCCMKYAAQFPAPEIIPFHDQEGGDAA